MTGINAEKHVDPVLIFDYTKHMPPNVEMKNYMIVYTYPGRITNPNEIKAIQAYAKKNGLTLVSIGHYFSWCDKTIVPHPFEVLAYFKHATCIITDTFHGSVFSIKYNKRFCTIIRDMNSQKLSHLLEQFNLTNRIVRTGHDIFFIMDQPIDYIPINNMIHQERERSLNYLKKNLN